MRFHNRIAVSVAWSPLALSSFSGSARTLMAAAFTLKVQPGRAVSDSGASSTVRFMSKMDQSFKTWSFDEPCTTMEWNKMSTASLTASAMPTNWDEGADLVVVGVYAPKKDEDEDDSEDKEEEDPTVTLEGSVRALDEKLGGALSNLMLENAKAFNHGAEAGSMTPVLRVFRDGKSQRFVVMGMGSMAEDEKENPFAGVGSKIGKSLATTCDSEKKVKSATLLLPGDAGSSTDLLNDLSTAFHSTLYADNRFRTGKKVKTPAEDLESVNIVAEGSLAEGALDSLDAGRKLAAGVFLTKDIVNGPHNVVNSLSLADTAKRIAEESGGVITCKILGKKECEERGMGAYLGVARGSETEPQFIHLTYTPPDGKVNKKIGVIGKGLLFDTGGYNIKTMMMELMKFDCGGAAAVLGTPHWDEVLMICLVRFSHLFCVTIGAARAVGALQPPGVEAHFVVAACENMINERAVVPSDILTASNGKTIEVLNTDAEGRLTLADALVYCDKELDCSSIIELSTLTGACMVALGKGVCGVWTDDEDLATDLVDIAKVTEEKAWRMPLEKSYNKELESKIADIKNIGGRYGGAITAALFLQNFVDKKKPYAHIDIAGPVWDDGAGAATGYGAKLVTEWVRRSGHDKK